MRRLGICLCLVVTLLAVRDAGANSARRSEWLADYPDACQTLKNAVSSCILCHSGVPSLNPYGQAYNGSWIAIESLDSDNDGVTNGQEILDCTLPGDPNSVTPTEPGSWSLIKSLYR